MDRNFFFFFHHNRKRKAADKTLEQRSHTCQPYKVRNRDYLPPPPLPACSNNNDTTSNKPFYRCRENCSFVCSPYNRSHLHRSTYHIRFSEIRRFLKNSSQIGLDIYNNQNFLKDLIKLLLFFSQKIGMFRFTLYVWKHKDREGWSASPSQ